MEKELSAEQKKVIEGWIREGEGLSEVQRRIEREFEIRMTYMDVRFLVDDLELDLVEPVVVEPDKKEEPGTSGIVDASGNAISDGDAVLSVSVTVDKITRPSALVSGTVHFTDGVKGAWLLDQTGRLALDGVAADYRPSEPDMESFQKELKAELGKLGY